jgi:hypothetical protein
MHIYSIYLGLLGLIMLFPQNKVKRGKKPEKRPIESISSTKTGIFINPIYYM